MRTVPIISLCCIAALTLSCCKDPIPPEPPITTKLPSVSVKILGILPDSVGTIPLANVRVFKANTLLGTTNDSGCVRIDSFSVGSNSLRLTTTTGTAIADTVLTLNLADTVRFRSDTLLLRLALSQEQASNFIFTIPLAVGNEWTYEFNEAYYGYRGRALVLLTRYSGTYTVRIINRKLVPAPADARFTNVVYEAIGLRSMTVAPVDGASYQITDTIPDGGNGNGVGVFMSFTSDITGQIITPIRKYFAFGMGHNYPDAPQVRGFYGISFAEPPYILLNTPRILNYESVIVKDTLKTGASFGKVHAVHNIGLIYSETNAVVNLNPISGTFTLKSYKLQRP